MKWFPRWHRCRCGAELAALRRRLHDAEQANAAAEAAAETDRAERNHAWEEVARLTRRVHVADADRLRGERDDLLLENAVLRGRVAYGDREELLRARETIARLTARLDAIEVGRVTL